MSKERDKIVDNMIKKLDTMQEEQELMYQKNIECLEEISKTTKNSIKKLEKVETKINKLLQGEDKHE